MYIIMRMLQLYRIKLLSKKKKKCISYFTGNSWSICSVILSIAYLLLKEFFNCFFLILGTYAAGGLPYWFIQGTRTGASLTWFDDSGNPLIYLPSTVTSQNSLTSTRLSLTLQLGGFQYEALQPTTTSNRFVCEI